MAVDIAKGIHDHPELKLGAVLKKDNRTINLGAFLQKDEISAPVSWDFDARRKPFPMHMWGNDAYGDCEIAARCNMLLRLERVETKHTPHLTDQDCIDLYKQMTGCESPGDNNDTGLTTVDNLNQWRSGWKPTDIDHTYSVAAYGYVNHRDLSLVRLASYLFHGVIVGAALPVTVQQQFENGEPWDVVENAGWEAEPGSWGGHALYTKAYDADHIKLMTWKTEVLVTNAWWDTYVEESYAVVDSVDLWRNVKYAFDVEKLVGQMRDMGIRVYE